jgi:two-component system phosphate regulon sensor histidine kinase PhoR
MMRRGPAGVPAWWESGEEPVNESSRASAELAAYEELRAGFTAAVSHELRTPLARLLALLESALLGGDDSRALLEQARDEVHHMNELIDEVLFLSELETGREVVSLGPTQVEPVVREVFEELSDRAARANVRLEAAVEPRLEMPLRPRLLRVVIENLAGNAISYAGEGSRFRLSGRRADSEIVLEAEDDGAGVDPEDLPRLFERFFRSDRARASRGTGLGLAIVKHIVTAAGGTVEAGNARDGGLLIRCTFAA